MSFVEEKKLIFKKEWSEVTEVVIFGAGHMLNNLFNEINGKVDIVYIIDNNPSKFNTYYENVKIISLEEYMSLDKKYKLIVSTHYDEISQQLNSLGMKKDVDFCFINEFILLWSWIKKDKLCLPEVHIAITTKCTLRCKHCNMYIPYYRSQCDLELSEVMSDIDLLFNMVDRVGRFAILGGEPFTCKYLKEIIIYLTSNYQEKIGECVVVTNGTIIPTEEMLELLKQLNITVSISDYSNTINYKEKLDEFEKRLASWNIKYYREISGNWLDFRFPHEPISIRKELLSEHMQSCAPIFKGVNDGKFYYCHLVWSAVRAGLLEADSQDYIDLKTLESGNMQHKELILRHYLGDLERGFVSLCQYCGGCSKFNKKEVEPAIQVIK